MIWTYVEECNDSIMCCVKILKNEIPSNDPVLEIELGEEGDRAIMTTYDHYIDLLSRIAKNDTKLQEDVLLEVGNQIVGWEDVTASLTEVTSQLRVGLELVLQVIFNDEETFDGTDGVDSVTISPIGWERYLVLKEKEGAS